jgi:hypothetical protein
MAASELEATLIQIRALHPSFRPLLAASGGASQFAGVCLHKLTRRYHAQYRGKTVGAAASDLEAAILGARSRGVPVVTLLKRTDDLTSVEVNAEVPGLIGRKRGQSQFSCVMYNSGTKRWIAKYKGTHCGDAATDLAAAITVSKRFGVPLPVLLTSELQEKYERQRLLLPSAIIADITPGVSLSPPRKRRRMIASMIHEVQRSTSSKSSSEDSDRFQAIMNVYREWLPAGWENYIKIRKDFLHLPLEAPLLHLVCLLEPEPWFQNLLVSLWQANRVRRGNTVRRQHAVLIKAARLQAAGSAGRTACILNLNKAGPGWLSTYQFWGIIVKDDAGDLHVAGKSFAINDWSSELRTRLHGVQDAAVAMNSLEVPRTLLEWQAVYQIANKLDLGAAVFRSVKPLLFRAWMVVEMRVRGIKRLAAAKPMTVDAFAAMFPDQCQWVHSFGVGYAAIQGVWAAQHYKLPPELYAMHTCFAGHPAVQGYKAAWISECELPLKAGVAAYRAARGWTPSPAVLLPIVHNAMAL